MNKKLQALIFFINFWTPWAFSQDVDTEELNIIEVELEKAAPKINPQKSESPQNQSPPPAGDFGSLGKLAPFSEVSVLQKKFNPKTGRFQLFAGGGVVTNDAFFNTLGGNLRLGYFFNESLGVEASYMALTTSEAKSTKELKDIQGVTTENIVYPKSYLGLDLVWVPIYGKITYFNRRIINFDMYFSLGGGNTTIQDNKTAGTLHLGAGQIFSLSKRFSLRWDFSWNSYSAKQIDQSSSTVNNLFLTAGVSFFFPEAKYR